jgi:hypothetical protein
MRHRGRQGSMMRLGIAAAVLAGLAMVAAPASASRRSYASRSYAPRVSYGGGHHTSSHGGHYSGSYSGSSHRGGSYHNVRTSNRYGRHK